MVNIKINGDTIIFEVEGWDKLWALRSSLEIPVAHIKDVYRDPDCAMGWLDGLKIIGTGIPNIFKAGTFYQQGDLVFWDVHHAENTITIELEHEHFGKLVIEVTEPNDAIALIKNVMVKKNP